MSRTKVARGYVSVRVSPQLRIILLPLERSHQHSQAGMCSIPRLFRCCWLSTCSISSFSFFNLIRYVLCSLIAIKTINTRAYRFFVIFQISFPGVKMYAFHILLCYMYSDKIPSVEPSRCLELLELANRLCMDRLVSLVEARVVDHLQRQDRCSSFRFVSRLLQDTVCLKRERRSKKELCVQS